MPVVLVGAALMLALLVDYYWHSSPFTSLFICAVLISAWIGGLRPGLLAVSLSCLAFVYYFVPPTHTLAINVNEMPRVALFGVASLVVCLLAASQRNATESLRSARDDLAAKVDELHQTNDALQAEVAERKLAELALRRGESYLAEAQRLSHTGSFGWKVSTGEILWSDETFRIFQYDRTTKPTLDLVFQRIHPGDIALVKQAVERGSREGGDFDLEHRLLMPDGSIKHLHVVAHAEKDLSGELEFIGAVMDVTVAKEAEDKIRLIINTVPGLLWTARPDGWVDFLNQRWLDYTGMALEQGLGWGWQPGYHPDDLGNVLNKWRAAVAEVKPLEVEARLRQSNGEYRWFLKRAFPLFDRAGRVLGWYGGNIDVHDLKQAEQKLRRGESYLAEAQRLSHAGSFGWRVSTGEIFWSEETFRIFESDRTTTPTVDFILQRVHPEDRDAVKRTFEGVARDGKDLDFEHRLRMPDGTVKHLHVLAHAEKDQAGGLEFIGAVMDVTERKLAEGRIRQIIDAIPAYAWSTKPDGALDFVNQRFGEFTGLSNEKLLGWEWQSTIHPDDLPGYTHLRRATLAAGTSMEGEVRVRRSDGQYRWLLVRRVPVHDEKGNIHKWYGTAIDIEDRKRAEEALRRSETYLTEAQRLSHTGSWAWNVKTRENVFWSKEHFRIYGFDPETSSGDFQAARDRIHPVDVPGFDETVQQAIHEQKDFETHHRIILPDGGVRHIRTLGHPVVNDAGELVEFIGTTMDITEQVEARAALNEAFSKIKKSEASLRTIIDTIPTLAWSGEADGSVEFVNLRWSNYTGLTTEQARGLRWQAAIHPDDVGWIANQWRIAMAAGKPSELEARLRRYDGQYRWFIHRAEPLMDEQGRIIKWFGINTDIDDRKCAEEALRQAQAHLAHVSRVTTMGELAASIAHEVNQPLTAVINNANVCLGLLPDNDNNLTESREALSDIIDDANRASDVIARIRLLAKKAPIEKSLLDLKDVVQDVLALAHHESASRQIEIHTDLSQGVPYVFGDRVQLQQVLLNLVVNGMDAMSQVEESRRVLKIGARCETRDEMPAALISVQDSGTGVKPGEMDRLFEAFYTTKPQGLGLGLAISHSIIEAHGGRLWAEPNPGPGTTFLFSLPQADQAAYI